MDKLEYSSSAQRRARTRSLIQLGGILEKAGIVETFGISLGADLQKDLPMKKPIAALFKALIDLNSLAQSDGANMTLWAQQGLEALGALNNKR
jgi:hypothetical protein